MLTSDFDYFLPSELIAQAPPRLRSASRLLVLERQSGATLRTEFERLPRLLRPGDLLVLNNSRVIPARLRAWKPETGGQMELLLLEPAEEGGWWSMVRPGKRVRPGSILHLHPALPNPIPVQVAEKNPEGHCRLLFPEALDVVGHAQAHGEMPLPPYIERPTPIPEDVDRYQTVYARDPGSVAAPTAGLHFTPELLSELGKSGIQTTEITLHVGVGTFAPVKAGRVADHRMHSERFEVSETAAEAVNLANREGRRVVAVGTTSLRVLESVARDHHGALIPGRGRTSLFLYPPADFRVVRALLTNFHLPHSTLLMLVSAFADPGGLKGRNRVLEAYREAVEHRFRFFSFGDAMLIQ